MLSANRSEVYQGRYIYNANGDRYCVVITDRAKAQSFIANHNESDVVGSDNAFKEGSDFFKAFDGATRRYAQYGTNDAWCHALSHIADIYDMGVTIMKMDAGSASFTSKHAVKTINNRGKERYIAVECR